MTPIATLGRNAAKQRWHVSIKWPDGSRTRHLLGASLDDNPGAEFEAFKRDALPALIAERRPKSKQGALLRDVATWYLETHLPYVGRNRKTIEYYASSLYGFLAYCASRHIARAGQLSTRIIQEWQIDTMRAKGRERPQREQILHVRRWLTVAVESGEIHDLPDIKWEVPKKRKGQQHRAHAQADIAAWVAGLTAWRPAAGLVAQWVAATGWRISDVLDLRVGECDTAAKWIDRSQIKTSENLPYPITVRMADILATALHGRKPGPQDHVFLNHKRQPWQYPALYRVVDNFNRPRHWAGEPITFRDLRKSFGTHLAMAGCPPNVLKELMGHGDIAITLSYYVEVDRDAMRKWAESGNPVATPS